MSAVNGETIGTVPLSGALCYKRRLKATSAQEATQRSVAQTPNVHYLIGYTAYCTSTRTYTVSSRLAGYASTRGHVQQLTAVVEYYE